MEVNALLGSNDDYIIDGFLRTHKKLDISTDIVDCLRKYTKPIRECKVIAAAGRKESKWIGGSILAQQSNFRKMCTSQHEYDEYGVKIVNRKCY